MAERRNFYSSYMEYPDSRPLTEREALALIVEDDGWDELPETMMQAAHKWPGDPLFKVTISVERVK